MQKTAKKALSFSTDTLERYRARYPQESPTRQLASTYTRTPAPPPTPPPTSSFTEAVAQKPTEVAAATTTTTTIATTTTSTTTKSTAGVVDIVASTALPTPNEAQAKQPAKPPKIFESINIQANTTTTSAAAAKNVNVNGSYINWTSSHTTLAAHAWCAMSDLMYFCDKYEFKSLSVRDTKTHQQIQAEARALLAGQAPFGQRKRFPADIRDPENLFVCIGRCAGVEYHLNRILSAFRKPLDQLSPDKQRSVRQNFHLALSELRLDISARISEVRLYDRLVFEREFRLEWQNA